MSQFILVVFWEINCLRLERGSEGSIYQYSPVYHSPGTTIWNQNLVQNLMFTCLCDSCLWVCLISGIYQGVTSKSQNCFCSSEGSWFQIQISPCLTTSSVLWALACRSSLPLLPRGVPCQGWALRYWYTHPSTLLSAASTSTQAYAAHCSSEI
jgi:hypothetical protein